MKQTIPQAPMPTNLTQNFQLAPTNQNAIKYANSIDEVNKSIVIGDTPFFSNDMSVLWLKDTKGNIKTFELNEIIPKDEKDLMIENLQLQIQELKGMIKNEQYVADDNVEYDEPSATKDDGATRTTIEKDKSTSLQRISTSKKR